RGDYYGKEPPVIGPPHVFSTPPGAPGDNWGFSATYDAAGNFYGGSLRFGPGNYPGTPGAARSSF
ncbi:hypothetical protein, partial [Chitinophaga sp. GbtcB8]|uniref:hypothetical protein n=1 Tax=Chitinophaga sp. GbtcB8 TaxID=2824753 RepID=UPI001C2FCFDB